MKVRESGMPDETWWQTFFDPPRILTELDLNLSSGDVVDFGCGYGLFTLPAASLTTGRVFAFDIDPVMVEFTTHKALEKGLSQVNVYCRDFMEKGTGLQDASVGYVMLFNILHAEQPLTLLNESFRILVPGGKVGILHWNHDPSTPRGPSLDIRPIPEQCRAWAASAGFIVIKPQIELPPYHYGIVGQKPLGDTPCKET
ncbi:class I SAM-dependent methyltransferase [Deltaproteobacteria bacterium TL4]